MKYIWRFFVLFNSYLVDRMILKSIVRSSAAEYLIFIAATGESNVNAIYFDENVCKSNY